ncbi:helix-turn-helix domain-containing protein [Paeniglutamicibacter psychrophenolicus]|uniref:helix-turn-helix domain-containing protein n=1 Tax=Paeniglutamicibacter psychrophenolicus TaxID=257454 RepID=UPI002788A2B5|nr:transposase [Paeniglutamicibacter psychrophenolicus]
MVKRYRYRLYPDDAQRGQLARTFGCARVVHNDVVAARGRPLQPVKRRRRSLT